MTLFVSKLEFGELKVTEEFKDFAQSRVEELGIKDLSFKDMDLEAFEEKLNEQYRYVHGDTLHIRNSVTVLFFNSFIEECAKEYIKKNKKKNFWKDDVFEIYGHTRKGTEK